LAAKVTTDTSSVLRDTIKAWDVDTRQIIWESERVHDELTELKFSPDQRRIATSSGSEIKLWDSENWQELLTLPGHAHQLAFDSTGTTLVGMMGLMRSYSTDYIVLREARVQRWDASRLTPKIEAEQIVDALSSNRIKGILPLNSEIIRRIKQDESLSDETRTAAINRVGELRREKELFKAAQDIASTSGQP